MCAYLSCVYSVFLWNSQLLHRSTCTMIHNPQNSSIIHRLFGVYFNSVWAIGVFNILFMHLLSYQMFCAAHFSPMNHFLVFTSRYLICLVFIDLICSCMSVIE